MAGCGVRALRWGLESVDLTSKNNSSQKDLEIWVNDADPERAILLKKNLRAVPKEGVSVSLKNESAERLLAKSYLDECWFDFIDVDCFGCPNDLLYPLIRVLAPDGIVFLTSTDGRSSTGHDRSRAIRRLSAAARTHPSSWEIALRLQLGAFARHAWLQGKGLEPVVSFSEGRTFRLAVQIRELIGFSEEANLGLMARCDSCGAQSVQSLISLKDWPSCDCENREGRWDVIGPLWIGPLQKPHDFFDPFLLKESCQTIDPSTIRLIERLKNDDGTPIFCWSTHELARRLKMKGPPSNARILDSLLESGFAAKRSAVMPGQLRTNASLKDLLRICEEMGPRGT